MHYRFFPLFIGLLCAMSSCKTVTTPEQTARTFIKALNAKAYPKARKYSTPKTHEMIKTMQSLSQMQDVVGLLGGKMGGASHKFADVQNMTCTENGDIANCAYCCNTAGKNASVRLVREKGKWLVDMGKENALGLDLGGNMPETPQTPRGEIPPSDFPDVFGKKSKATERLPTDSLELKPDEVAKRFVQGLADKDYFEIQNLSSSALNTRIVQSRIAQQVLADSSANGLNLFENYTMVRDIATKDSICEAKFKAKDKPELNLILQRGYDAEWRVVKIEPAASIAQPDQTNPKSVAAYFITFLLNGSWDDAEAISTPETARTITFLTRTAMNRPESFDNLAKLNCIVNAERASCSYCCNPLNNEDTIILVKKDGKWWVDWRLK